MWSSDLAPLRPLRVMNFGPTWGGDAAAGWGGVSSRILAPPRSRIFTSVFFADGEVSQVGSRVELFEAIRRDRRSEALSIRKLAERHKVHRRAVRQALASALPPPRKEYVARSRPATDPWSEVIDVHRPCSDGRW